MTGFGNAAFNVLRGGNGCELIGVFAPKRHNTLFPYYDCEQLQDIAKKNNVELYEGLVLRGKKTLDIIKSLSPDLIVVSSFKQILPESVIKIPRLGVINVHPSLLPRYRGATPTTWALINGEEETGVTVHYIEDENPDKGDIIAQAALRIDPGDNDGTLRYKLAVLSERVLADALKLIFSKGKRIGRRQDESNATYYPPRSIEDAEIKTHSSFRDILNKIRAMTPYPGAYINNEGKRHTVIGAVLLSNNTSRTGVIEEFQKLTVDTLDGSVQLLLSEGAYEKRP